MVAAVTKLIHHTFRIPGVVYAALTKSARANGRSINAELVFQLRRAYGITDPD